MSILQRMSNLVQGKVNKALDAAEDPSEQMDLSYEKQLEVLQKVKRNVADVLTSEKRLEMQAQQLRQNQVKLQGQAQQALTQGREDLARLALTRATTIDQQLTDLNAQIDQLKTQEQKLEVMAQKLQAKVEAFRTQKETIKAQYTAAEASTRIGEAVSGLSEQMTDVSMMVDRAQEKTHKMQARAMAIDQLVDSGTLDQLGSGPGDDIERQLAAGSTDTTVNAQLEAMKQQMALPEATFIVRIQGDDQFRISQKNRTQLDLYDQKVVSAVNAGDEPAFRAAIKEAVDFVRGQGIRLPHDQIVKSDEVLPSDDMALEEARGILSGATT